MVVILICEWELDCPEFCTVSNQEITNLLCMYTVSLTLTEMTRMSNNLMKVVSRVKP